jgi:hypothetical protein
MTKGIGQFLIVGFASAVLAGLLAPMLAGLVGTSRAA